MPVRRLTLISGAALAALTLLTPFASGGSEEHSNFTAEELAVLVTERITNIETLDCDFLVDYHSPEGAAGRRVTYRFAREGRNWHFTELSTDESSHVNKENTTCFDGDKVYSLRISTNEDSTKKWNMVGLQDGHAQGNIDPEYLSGAKLSNINRSLADVLSIKTLKRLPTDDPNALVLNVTGISADRTDSGNTLYDVTVELDATHDFLPRDILVTQSKETITWPGWSHRWKILEYRQVLDEASGKERWFPVRGRLEQGSRRPPIDLTVQTVRINAKLDPTLFHPEIPDGTTIMDETTSGAGRLTVKGGTRHVASTMDDGDDDDDGDDNTVDDLATTANDSSRSWPRWILALNGIAILGCVVCLLWRRSRRKGNV
jgi:outer membrane lipoprotein-sorting protein